MFNEEQKNNYLNSVSENNEKYIKSVHCLFNNIAEIESNLELDFCQLDRESAIDVIAQVSGRKKPQNRGI